MGPVVRRPLEPYAEWGRAELMQGHRGGHKADSISERQPQMALREFS